MTKQERAVFNTRLSRILKAVDKDAPPVLIADCWITLATRSPEETLGFVTELGLRLAVVVEEFLQMVDYLVRQRNLEAAGFCTKAVNGSFCMAAVGNYEEAPHLCPEHAAEWERGLVEFAEWEAQNPEYMSKLDAEVQATLFPETLEVV